MRTQDQIIDAIVKVLSQERQVTKVFFFTHPVPNSSQNKISLIIYEDCDPDYIISQFKYETLLKNIGNDVILNILPVNCMDAQKSLDKRLEDYLCIYNKKVND